MTKSPDDDYTREEWDAMLERDRRRLREGMMHGLLLMLVCAAIAYVIVRYGFGI